MSEDTSKEDEILVSRGGTEYERDGEVHVIDYGGYPLVDINPELITEEISLLAKIADLLEVSDEYLSLEGKTQVINAAVDSPETLITTRLIHDMQVSQNAMRIAKALGGSVKDIMLARIGGLAHDIGHAPFGHAGQAALSSTLEEFFPGSRFAHDRYGGEIIDTIIGRAIASPEEGLEGFQSEDEEELLGPLREEIRLAVINHSRYFSYRMKNETLSQKSVRLADTLSFMVTDLSDLMKAEDARELGSGKRILSLERMYAEISKMPFLSMENKKKLREIAKKLLIGGPELKDVHETLIREAFSEDRPILDDNESATIIDDIKLLYDIESIAQKMNKADNVKTRIEAFRRLGEYYRYISNLKTDSQLRINYHFKAKMCKLLGFSPKEEEKALEKIENLIRRLGDIDYSERTISDIPFYTTEELEVIKRVTDNILDDSDPTNLRVISKEASNAIISCDIDNAPTLLTLFTIQNRVQYGEILASKDGKEALGNDEVVMPDGTTAKVEDLIRERFRIVFKMAREFSKTPDAFTEETRDVEDLTTYFGRTVPKFYGQLFGNPHEEAELSYALFAIQQMQNKDFLDDSIVHKIRQSLGISMEQFESMQEELKRETEIRRDVARREAKGSDPINYVLKAKGLMRYSALFGEVTKEEEENPTLEEVIERSRKIDELRSRQINTYEEFELSGLKKEWEKSYIKSAAYFNKLAELINRGDYERVSRFLTDTFLKAVDQKDYEDGENGGTRDDDDD